MGGKKGAERPWKQSSGSDYYAGYQPGRSWQYWPGTWSSPKNKAALPQRYDQMQVQSAQAQSGWTEESYGVTPSALGGEAITAARDQGDLLRRQVQRALTISKRCETKIRKLAETKETRHIQWKAWKDQLKSSFLKQQKQFEKDQAALDSEMATLRAQGEEAAQSMQQLVLHGPAAMDTEAPPETGPESGAWEAFVGGPPAEAPTSDFMRQAYAFAQLVTQSQGHQMGFPGGQRGLGLMPPAMMERMVGCPPPPRAPNAGTAEAGMMDGHLGGPACKAAPPAETAAPPYSAADTGQVRAGPFSRSPMAGGMNLEARNLGPEPPGIHPGPPGLSPHVPAPPDHQSGTNPAEANLGGPPLQAVPLPGGDLTNTSPLAEMLRTKRQEGRRVMEPFGGARSASAQDTNAEDAGRPPGEAENQSCPFIDDDSEDKDAVRDIPASPGLGRLE